MRLPSWVITHAWSARTGMRDLFRAISPRGLYRPDLDGIRALAVLAVVAYHYSPANFPGGFIGVDIFFVISGYLITGILVRGVEDREFNTYGELLSDFYQRRVRRIFPALILVLTFCLIAGWLVLFASEYARVGKYVAAGAGYVENFVLWHEAGYFDHSAITKPLLHLWSLAVEEQFYMFWPLVLWVVSRRGWRLLTSIGAIAVVTFVLNVVLVFTQHQTQAFYSPMTRTWELMTGAWLAVAHRRNVYWLGRFGEYQSWSGLLLILLGFVFIRPTSAFPGLWAALPVLGSALLINAGSSALLNARVLSWRPAVWVGLISYPLYLWHWMLLSLTVTVFGDSGTAFRHGSRAALFIVSVVLAWLTYRYVEGPIRHSRKLATSIALVAVVGVLGVSGLSVYLASGLPGRPATFVSAKAEQYVKSVRMGPLAQSRDCFNPQTRMTFVQRELHKQALPDKWYCVLGDIKSNRVILAYGDSHARAMIPALQKYGDVTHTRIVFSSVGSCLPLLEVTVNADYPRACTELGQRAVAFAGSARPAGVVLLAAWEAYLSPRNVVTPRNETPAQIVSKGLNATLARYHALGVPVLLVEDNPIQRTGIPIARIRFAREPTDDALNASAISRRAYDAQQQAINAIIRSALSAYPDDASFRSGLALCTADICPWVRGHQFLYYDDGHLSEAGALMVYPLLAAHLHSLLAGAQSRNPTTLPGARDGEDQHHTDEPSATNGTRKHAASRLDEPPRQVAGQ